MTLPSGEMPAMNWSSGGETAIAFIGTSPVPAWPWAGTGDAAAWDADSWTAPLLPTKYSPAPAEGSGTILAYVRSSSAPPAEPGKFGVRPLISSRTELMAERP